MGGLIILGIFSRKATGSDALVGVFASIIGLVFISRFTPINFLLYATIGVLLCVTIGYFASQLLPKHKKAIEGLTIYTILKR